MFSDFKFKLSGIWSNRKRKSISLLYPLAVHLRIQTSPKFPPPPPVGCLENQKKTQNPFPLSLRTPSVSKKKKNPSPKRENPNPLFSLPKKPNPVLSLSLTCTSQALLLRQPCSSEFPHLFVAVAAGLWRLCLVFSLLCFVPALFVGPAAIRQRTAGVGASSLARCVTAPPSCLAGASLLVVLLRPVPPSFFGRLVVAVALATAITPLFYRRLCSVAAATNVVVDGARRQSLETPPFIPLFFAALVSR
ncbi:hypothetical protein BVRB_017360, partial [Beta vulgaris subsp. vulgaris]